MDTVSSEIGFCRRQACVDVVLWRRLCRYHWNRWHDGVDLLDLPDDDAAAPPREVWVAPLAPGSVSLRTARWSTSASSRSRAER
jgi:hypothetical protein